MKKKIIKELIFIICCTITATFVCVFIMSNIDSNVYTVKNNSTRDYNYEHYCDSIYEVNPNYYFDVIVESDEFQQYIDNHGEWWTN